jgi:hypothetical protein
VAYRSSPIRRGRATKAEYEARRAALYDIVAEQYPMTVRQVFYQATVRGLIEKTEAGYSKIQWDLTVMRKAGELPYEWIEDGSRSVYKPTSYPNIAAALKDTAESYRKDLWIGGRYPFVEVWVEKDALTNVIYPVTEEYDVPLRPARGYASLSFLHDAASHIDTLDVPAVVFHLGDYDPSGVNAGESIENTLREMAPDALIYFERLAVTREQITDWSLPTRPTKSSDPRAASFGDDISVELDAIEPNRLRQIVREAIERHMPPEEFKALKQAEARERATLLNLVKKMTNRKSK